MDEQEELRRKQHWQELAEQLGLNPNEAPAAPPPAERTEPGPVPRPAVQTRPVLTQREPAPIEDDLTFSREPVIQREATETRVESLAPTSPPMTESEEPASEELPPEPWAEPQLRPDTEGEDDRPRRGRGRGRGRRSDRGGEAREPRVEEPAGAVPGGEAESSEEPPEGKRRRGRGRGRGRKNDGTRERPAPGDEAEAPRAKKEPALAEDEEENMDMSNWVVPSWNDLIASLYRPER
jgi:ribonuclease E